MLALYRKYRPETFKEVIDQEHITTVVQNELSQQKPAHAYLFVGPRGTGKTTLARIVARSLNCLNRKDGQYEPCNTCNTCTQILHDRYLDVMEIDAATHTQVENVREVIISSAYVPPLRANGYKVFIIDEVHMLSRHAFNALLKILEEPPSRVVFILATTQVSKVPETIISRCERFDFKLLAFDLIVKRLQNICSHERIKVPASVLHGIARLARGSLRDGESLLGQVLNLAEDGVVTEDTATLVVPRPLWDHGVSILKLLAEKNPADALLLINNLIEDGIDIDQLTGDFIELVRLTLIKKIAGKQFLLTADTKTAASIEALIVQFEVSDLHRLLDIVTKLASDQRFTIPQLPLELTCISYCEDQLPPPSSEAHYVTSTHSQKNKTSEHPVAPELSAVAKQWTLILKQLKDTNRSLAAFFKVGHPLKLERDTLTIGFQYGFHAETVLEEKNKSAAERIISSIMDRPILIDCIVDPNYTANHKSFQGTHESKVQDVLNALGGGELV